MADKLKQVIQALDGINAQDPRRVTVDGQEIPSELAYAERLTYWALKLDPEASDAVRIAARGQHVGRWTIPRGSSPEGRGGYLRWREDLKKFHAQKVAEAMESAGYEKELIERVRAIVLKKDLKQNKEAQTLEDALCLVFLESQFQDLKDKTPDPKMRDIVRKTWAKMSPQGQKAALALNLPASHRKFLEQSLNESN